jgi:aspartate 1-decarboxylase
MVGTAGTFNQVGKAVYLSASSYLRFVPSLNYTGSITIDENLIDAAGMIANQKVLIVNNNNGERFETYIIKGERGTGIIGLNGAAARKGQVGDELIIMTFVQMTPEEAKVHQPNNLFPDRNNQVI